MDAFYFVDVTKVVDWIKIFFGIYQDYQILTEFMSLLKLVGSMPR